jgi:hypothetical protein
MKMKKRKESTPSTITTGDSKDVQDWFEKEFSKPKEYATGSTTDTFRLLQEYLEERIGKLRAVLGSDVKRLNLSPKLLWSLMHHNVVFTELAGVESAFNRRLQDLKFSKLKTTEEQKDEFPWTSGYKEILYKAVEFCRQPLETPAYTLEEHREGLAKDDYPTPSIPQEFFEIADQILQRTERKKINYADLTENEKNWCKGLRSQMVEDYYPDDTEFNLQCAQGWGGEIRTVKDIMEAMMNEYASMAHQISERKCSMMNWWLKKHYPNLHEFYLHGKGRYGTNKRIFPAMRERLQNLDDLVKSKYADTVMIEIACNQLYSLIEKDPLFASVFYTYFYKQNKGLYPDLRKKALDKAKPYICFLKFFKIQPIDYKGVSISSIYDRGVLLLNALAGKTIYSTDKYDPLGDGEGGGVDGRYYEFKGARQLEKELDSFRQFWRKLS